MEPDAVCVLLPAYNEAATVADVVTGFREVGFENVLVIDGGSDDGTPRLAREAGARVVTQSGAGKGQAIREAVRDYISAEYVLLADADGTYRPEEACDLLEPLKDDYNHVIGNRFADMREGSMTRFNRIGNRIFNWLFELIHGESYGDILSGYRAFRRETFEQLRLQEDGFGIETEISVECARRKIKTAVIPITYLPRPSGSNTNLHPLKDGGIILMAMYRRARTSNPVFYFGSLGGFSAAVGLVVAAFIGYDWFVNRTSHDVLAVVAAAGILFGIQLVMFGVLSDLIVTLHGETMERLKRVERNRPPARSSERSGNDSGEKPAETTAGGERRKVDEAEAETDYSG